MKYLTALILLAASTAAGAQNIQWKPIGENAPEPFRPFQGFNPKPPVTIQYQVGPLTFGSDGSRTYSIDRAEPKPDKRFYQRNPDGSTSFCERYGENVFCRAL